MEHLHTAIPVLSNPQRILLDLLYSCRFNLYAFSKAARISPFQAAAFMALPNIQSALATFDAMVAQSTERATSQAKLLALDCLIATLLVCTNPIETRRLVHLLLRITAVRRASATTTRGRQEGARPTPPSSRPAGNDDETPLSPPPAPPQTQPPAPSQPSPETPNQPNHAPPPTPSTPLSPGQIHSTPVQASPMQPNPSRPNSLAPTPNKPSQIQPSQVRPTKNKPSPIQTPPRGRMPPPQPRPTAATLLEACRFPRTPIRPQSPPPT